MSITEIAATGLLRLMVTPASDSSSSELPESSTRAIALAALQATTGMRSPAMELPSRALTAPPRNTKSRTKTSHKSSGDYGADAAARLGRRRPDNDPEQDAPSTFTSLL